MGRDGAAADLLVLPDGRRVQFWVGGAVDGPAVVFLHGCPDTRHAAYVGDAAARRAGVRLVAVNRPGYGRSDASSSTHSSVADDVAATTSALGIDRFAVLGMSIGGPYAAACAARHPDRVSRLGLVASPGMAPAMQPPVHRDDLDAAGQRFYARLAAVSVEGAEVLVRPGYLAWVAGIRPEDPDDAALVNRWLAALSPVDAAIVRRQATDAIAQSVREALAQPDGYVRDAAISFREWDFDIGDVGVLTHIWCGDRDANAPLRNARWLAQRIRAADRSRVELHVLAGTGHLAALHDHWDEILRALTRP